METVALSFVIPNEAEGSASFSRDLDTWKCFPSRTEAEPKAEVERSCIPLLAKNERDLGHPLRSWLVEI